MTISVIIVTLNRADCMRRCLDCLTRQEPPPDQIIVVDASADNLTCEVIKQFSGVVYLRTDVGYGHMTASRNLGLQQATGDIIAFIDDDAFAHPGWLENLVATYSDPLIGAVGGRALNNQPNETIIGVNEIGQLKSNGDLTGYFAADPGKIIEVDHVVGCNMSFRRNVLTKLGGLREDYIGTEVREETDICLRVKALDYKVLYNPSACVDHIGAPQVRGKRFDARYAYYAQRNHLVLLIHNFGLGAPIVWRYLGYSLFKHVFSEFIQRMGAASIRLIATVSGLFMGILSGLAIVARTGRSPIRQIAKKK